jgi:uncharacterized protein YndB with AHSA1/START domain
LDTVSLDVKPGGAWKAQMIAEDGTEMPFGGFYRDVQEPERLVLTFEEAGSSDEERQVLTVTFNDLGDKTEVTVSQAGVLEQKDFDGLQSGYNSFLDKLEELLAKT